MKRYSNYEFISARWYNQIPIHWHLIRIKDLISQSNAGAWGDDPETDNGTICLRVADMDFNLGVFKNKPVSVLTKRLYTEEQIEKLTLEQGDILIEKSGGGEKSPVGRSVYFDKSYPALFANFMQRIRFKHKLIDAHFASYLLRTMYYRGATWYYVKQTTGIQNLDLNSMLAQERFPVPPREEQDQIVRYLDWQVSKINRLIAAKRKQIKLLEATTAHYLENTIHKGTHNEQLVETGNPWINSAPISWKKVRHKNVLTEKKEVVGENHSQYTLLSLTTKGVIIRDTSSGKGKYPSDFSTYQVVNPSNMVFCLFDVDETPRTVGLSTHTGMITGAYTVYETHDALPEYLLYYFLSVDNKKGFKPLYSGLRKVIGKDVFSRQAIYLPSIEEQKEIVDAIQIRQAKSRNAIDLLEREIESLHDLRTRLISDVVTGQVDVRDIKVPDGEYTYTETLEEETEEEPVADGEE